jgi:hypothetical protein
VGQATRIASYDSRKVQREGIKGLVLSGVISVLLVVLVFWLALALFPLTAGLPKTTTANGVTAQLDWNLLGSVASVATLALIVGGLVFAVSEYIQSSVQRRREAAEAEFNMYREVFDRIMNQEAVAARRWIIQNLPTLEELGQDQDAWLARTRELLSAPAAGTGAGRTAGQEHLKQVLNAFDFLGFVARYYWSIDNELVAWMSGPVAKVWERIYLHVECEARERNEPDFYENARWYGQHCLEWRRQNYPQARIISNAT